MLCRLECCGRKSWFALKGKNGVGQQSGGLSQDPGLCTVSGIWEPKEQEHNCSVCNCWCLDSHIMTLICSLWGLSFFICNCHEWQEFSQARTNLCFPWLRGWDEVPYHDRKAESFHLMLTGLMGENSLIPHTNLKNEVMPFDRRFEEFCGLTL